MREILFCGKRIDNGEWIEGYYVPACFGRFPCRPAIVPEPNDEWKPIEVNPKTVGQFAGLPDKNGTDIFEDDIVRVKYSIRCRGDSLRIVKVDRMEKRRPLPRTRRSDNANQNDNQSLDN